MAKTGSIFNHAGVVTGVKLAAVNAANDCQVNNCTRLGHVIAAGGRISRMNGQNAHVIAGGSTSPFDTTAALRPRFIPPIGSLGTSRGGTGPAGSSATGSGGGSTGGRVISSRPGARHGGASRHR